MLPAGNYKIQIFNLFHLSMIKFRKWASHVRKPCARTKATIASRRARTRPKIISKMILNLIMYYSHCVVGSARALIASILAKPRIRVPQDFSRPLPTKVMPTTQGQSIECKVSLFAICLLICMVNNDILLSMSSRS